MTTSTNGPQPITRIAAWMARVVLVWSCVCLPALVEVQGARAQTHTVLYSFVGAPSDGREPDGGLVLDPNGNLYGTTVLGGSAGLCKQAHHNIGCGTVFELSATGVEMVLFNFDGKTSGGEPTAAPAIDTAGNLYGTTMVGGSTKCRCGVLFKIDSDGTFSVLHRFRGIPDGAFPQAGVTLDAAGNLYGTTAGGGRQCPATTVGCGTVFKMSAGGKYSILHRFYSLDGIDPESALTLDAGGTLYGTTKLGATKHGNCNTSPGCGNIFKLDQTGHNFTVLHRFALRTNGQFPTSTLTLDASGNLYGTTMWGGDLGCNGGLGCGVVFELDPTGHETVLYRFSGGADGAYPLIDDGSLVRDNAGNLYGNTAGGGNLTCGGGGGCGVVFKVDPTGHETVLYSFEGGADGNDPLSGLVTDSAGNFYGTTAIGGTFSSACGVDGCGTIFKITP
jgi:uncharacterized repeat protein (TIGR03803 family)